MSVRKANPPPQMTPLEAACNMALYQEHQKEAGKINPRLKTELYFGVYRSRTFVVITRSTPWLERLKRYIQWLFGSISYKPEDISSLAERSRKQWVPAAEMAQLQAEQEDKVRQLEAAQNLKEQARQDAQNKDGQLNLAELRMNVLRTAKTSLEKAVQLKEGARVTYEKLHKEIQNRENAKNDDINQKQETINNLQLEVAKLNNAMQSSQKEYHANLTAIGTKVTQLRPLLGIPQHDPLEILDEALKRIRGARPPQAGPAQVHKPPSRTAKNLSFQEAPLADAPPVPVAAPPVPPAAKGSSLTGKPSIASILYPPK